MTAVLRVVGGEFVVDILIGEAIFAGFSLQVCDRLQQRVLRFFLRSPRLQVVRLSILLSIGFSFRPQLP